MSKTLERVLLASQAESALEIDHVKSLTLLWREYLRRLALWANALQCQVLWPDFDPAEQIDSSVRCTQEEIDALDNALKRKRSMLMIETLEAALHWEALSKEYPEKVSQLPNPYEAAVLFYVRGGRVSRDHAIGGLEINLNGHIRRPRFEEYMRDEPFVSLDPEALDQIDRNG